MASVPSNLIEAIFQVRGQDPLTQSLGTVGPGIARGTDVLRKQRQRQLVNNLFPQIGGQGSTLDEADISSQILERLNRPQQQRELESFKQEGRLERDTFKGEIREDLEKFKAENRPPSFFLQLGSEGQLIGKTPLGVTGKTVVGRAQRQRPALSAVVSTKIKLIRAALTNINQLEESFNKLSKAGKTGITLGALGAKASAILQQDADATGYNALKNAMVAFVGRNIGADVGNFSEKESRQYKKLIPGFISSDEAAAGRFQLMRENLLAKIEALQTDPSGFQGVDESLSQFSTQDIINQIIKGGGN